MQRYENQMFVIQFISIFFLLKLFWLLKVFKFNRIDLINHYFILLFLEFSFLFLRYGFGKNWIMVLWAMKRNLCWFLKWIFCVNWNIQILCATMIELLTKCLPKYTLLWNIVKVATWQLSSWVVGKQGIYKTLIIFLKYFQFQEYYLKNCRSKISKTQI